MTRLDEIKDQVKTLYGDRFLRRCESKELAGRLGDQGASVQAARTDSSRTSCDQLCGSSQAVAAGQGHDITAPLDDDGSDTTAHSCSVVASAATSTVHHSVATSVERRQAQPAAAAVIVGSLQRHRAEQSEQLLGTRSIAAHGAPACAERRLDFVLRLSEQLLQQTRADFVLDRAQGFFSTAPPSARSRRGAGGRSVR